MTDDRHTLTTLYTVTDDVHYTVNMTDDTH